MAQLDLKNRKFYDELNDEERKKFSTFLMLRYSSCVSSGPVELQKYYIQSCNEQMNKHFWDLNRHPKLQWLMATCVSPGMGKQRHEWIAFKGKGGKNKRANLLAKFYPETKMADLELLSDTMSDDEIKSLLRAHGYTDKQVKEALK